jgi:hypothetical protein
MGRSPAKRTKRKPPASVVTRARPRPDTAQIEVSVFDGRRSPISEHVELLVRILDGNQRQLHSAFHHGPRLEFVVPFHDNFSDRYTVIVSARGHRQAGFTPVIVREGERRSVDLMLVPKRSRFEFAAWADLPAPFARLLGAGVTPAQAKARYAALAGTRPSSLAALLNILTACSTVLLGHGTLMDYLKELVWGESMAQDRFFAFADTKLLQEVKEAAALGEFVPEMNPGILHPGATRSFKQVQFGEANVQLTFHENDTKRTGGVPSVKVELDVDYFRDAAAHALLEVVPGLIGGQRTDPETAYVLRWIAGRFAGVPEFDPPFTIVPA